MIDFHQHLWPPELVVLLRARTAPPCIEGDRLTTREGTFRVDLGEHRLDTRLAELDHVGAAQAVISLQPTLGIHLLPDAEAAPLADAYHEGALALQRQSDGRLRALAAGAALDGFAGACIPASMVEPNTLPALADDLALRGQLLFVHPGPASRLTAGERWWAPVVDYTAQMQAAYAEWLTWGASGWPQLPVVFAILAGGAPFQLERLAARGGDASVALHANTYLDTASYGRLALELCLAAYGVGRLVYGSDSPVIDPSLGLDAIRSLGKETADVICSRNALALLV